MKKVLLTGATTALLVTSQMAMAAPSRLPICLPTRNIASTSPAPDGTAITFRMTDGSVWRNDLRGRCRDMRWNGFAWSTANPMASVCEYEQTLTVMRTGETCGLGKFTQLQTAGQHTFSTGER